MVILKSPPGAIYNSSPRRPSPREVVQIPDTVRILPLCPAPDKNAQLTPSVSARAVGCPALDSEPHIDLVGLGSAW